jgi:DNA polymerase III alpha subunit
LIRELRGENVNISKIPLDDKNDVRFAAARRNNGVFQFESSGMRRYMKDHKADRA